MSELIVVKISALYLDCFIVFFKINPRCRYLSRPPCTLYHPVVGHNFDLKDVFKPSQVYSESTFFYDELSTRG